MKSLRFIQRSVLSVAVALLFIGLAASAEAKAVKTDRVKPHDVQAGTYNVIGYEQETVNGPIRVAILQKEDAPNIKFKTPGDTKQVTGLTQDNAIRQAEAYVKANPAVTKTELSKMYDADGTLIGYEMSPIFLPMRYGSSDVVDSHFRISEDRTLAYVTVDPLLQQVEQGGG
jgi:hypothetical protein